MSVLDNAEEFGRRVRAARGYVGEQKPAFARRMGYSAGASTVARWEAGDLGKKRNNPEGRRGFAEEIIMRTEAPRSLFELDDEPLGILTGQVEALARVVAQLVRDQDRSDLERELARVDGFAQLLDSTPRPTEVPAPGSPNG